MREIRIGRAAREPGVIQQVRRAFASGNRLGAVVGLLLGGFVPIALYSIAHQAGFSVLSGSLPTMQATLVTGGLLYSAQTVYQWARLAFAQATKAVGFCLLLEGVMVTSGIHWLAVAALCYLVGINGIATACQLGRARA